MACCLMVLSDVFQSTLSMRRATDDDPGQRHGYRISIHALHEESDMLRESEAYGPSSFQSTLSMRRATQAYSLLSVWDGFQSTLSMRRATGGDFTRPLTSTISIHALHEESDLSGSVHTVTPDSFQSTLSMRRATLTVYCPPPVADFNPRSP